MNHHTTLRPATPADAAEIARLYLCSRRQFLPYAPLAHSDEEVKHWIREQVLPSAQVTVAQSGGELLGFIASTDGSGNEERCPDVLYQRPAAAMPR